MMALNEFSIVFDQFESTDYSGLAKVLFCGYMVIASILLINMLIAMLGKTYQDIASQPNESLRQWARALLIVERMWTRKERLQMLDSYSRERSVADGGGRYYGTTWALDVSIKIIRQTREFLIRISGDIWSNTCYLKFDFAKMYH